MGGWGTKTQTCLTWGFFADLCYNLEHTFMDTCVKVVQIIIDTFI